MGNTSTCMPDKGSKSAIEPRSRNGSRSMGSRSYRRMATDEEEEELHRRALAMAIREHQHSQRSEGSIQRSVGSSRSRKGAILDQSSSRKQAPIILDNLETKKVVLVHGEGFGAWCWYKIIPLLEEVGLHPVALDLKGSGVDRTAADSITTLADYTKPLIDYLQNLPEDEKVILVGHSNGGASISYAIECCPEKISKSIFICATMVMDGQRAFDVFADEVESAEVFMQGSQLLLYGNGRDQPPTGLMFDKEQIKGLCFNQSPAKDIALATASMRPIPLAPIMEKLSLTPERYGSIHRFYVRTLDDRMLSLEAQEKMVCENPPIGVYDIKGSDHCPFFSKPQSLNKILLEIVRLPVRKKS